MTFVWMNKQGVRNNQGFEVQVVDRFCIEYREGNHILSIEVEDGIRGGKPCLLVSPSFAKRWDNGPLGQLFDDEKRLQIEKNFCDAMMFQGLEVVVEC